MTEYDDGKIWYRKKGKLITLGVTEKVFEELGDLESVALPSEGDEISQDDVIGELSGTRGSFEIITPVDGSISAVNNEISDNPDVLAEDPLDEGWICQIRIESVSDDEEESSDED